MWLTDFSLRLSIHECMSKSKKNLPMIKEDRTVEKFRESHASEHDKSS